MPWWIYVIALALTIMTFVTVAIRWHHEGLEDSLEDLTSTDMAAARSGLWRLSQDKRDEAFADGSHPDLVEYHFTLLWGMERAWFRRERIIKEATAKLFRWPSTRYDDAIRPHVSECLRSCAFNRLLAAYPDGELRIQDGQTWKRVQRLAKALGLDEKGDPLATT